MGTTTSSSRGGDRLIVGRERELTALRAAAQSAASGRGRCVVVSGVAGIGKTTLLREGAALARAAGLDVLHAAGRPMESTFAHGLARRLLDGTRGAERVAAADGPAGPGAVEELLWSVAALAWPDPGDPRHRPLALVVDDLQWADRASARFLAVLADGLEDLPVALLVASRPGDGGAPADALQPVLARDHVEVLRPAALGEDEVAAVLRHHAGEDPSPALVTAVLRAGGGNPFSTHALARALDGAGPQAVSGLVPEDALRSVMGRLAELGDDAAALARALAVLGDGVPLRLAAELAELPADAADAVADAMARAALLAPGEPLRFAHPLVGGAVRAEQEAFALARLHRRAAELLARDGAPPERVGEHLVRARGEADPAVVAWLTAAAAAARRRGDAASAVRFLQRALQEPPPQAERVDVLLELVEARTVAADPAVLDDAEAIVHELPSAPDRARVLATLATLAHHFGDFARAIDLAEAGLELLDPAERPGSALQERWLSTALLVPEHIPRARAMLRGFIDGARDGTLPPTPGLCALAAMEATVADDGEVVARLARGAFAGGPLVARDDHGTALGYAGAALTWTGHLEESIERMEAALAEARRRGAVVAQAIAHHWHGIAALAVGRLDDALADAERTAALHAHGWAETAWGTPLLVDTWLARGEPERARAVVDAVPDDSQHPDRPMLLEARARLRLAEHDHAGALDDACASGVLVEQFYGRRVPRAFGWRAVAADACRGLGRDADARRYAREAVDDARPLATAGPLGTALVALGRALDGDEALTALREAVAVLGASEFRLAHAEALVALGAGLRRAGRREDARAVLFEGFALAERLGAHTLAREARRELNALGVRPRRAALSGRASLTASELHVAELAAAGLSNPRIAHHLVISRRTVESHLARVYRKLGIAGRHELARSLDGP